MVDRQIVYQGATPRAVDQLLQSKNTMIGLGYLMQAVLGTSTLVDGLACTPNSPAALNVLVAPGSIYSLQNVDNTAYGIVAADTADQIVKQGIVMSTATLSCPAPGTAGQSIVYLVQAAYQDQDTGALTLNYYNASNPSSPFNGPANTGVSQNTVRQGVCVVQVKAGTAATTGSQVTPAADGGFVGLWAITVANGQTTITSPNIVQLGTAPFIATKLTGKLSAASNLSDVASVSTARTNLGLGSAALLASSAVALTANNLSDLASASTARTNLGLANAFLTVKITLFTSSATYTPTAGLVYADVIVHGGGGAGGGGHTTTGSGGAGGTSGSSARKVISAATIGASQSITIAAGGAAGTAGTPGTSGGNGGTSSFGAIMSATGGNGGGYGASTNSATIGASGTGSGGTVNGTGNAGNNGFAASSVSIFCFGGAGGAGLFGGAGAGGNPGAGAVAGVNGAGGGGGYGGGNGGAGGAGFCLIVEYCNQ